jgi:hypothetical protein
LTTFACSLISDVHSLAHTHDEDRRTAMSRLSSDKVGGNRSAQMLSIKES